MISTHSRLLLYSLCRALEKWLVLFGARQSTKTLPSIFRFNIGGGISKTVIVPFNILHRSISFLETEIETVHTVSD